MADPAHPSRPLSRPPAEILIERVTKSDADIAALVRELDDNMGALYAPEQQHGFRLEELFRPGVTCLMAHLDGAPVGCGAVASFDGYAEVKRMYTRPSARGRGVAGAILGRLEQEARRAGHTLIRLETGVYSDAAIALYEGVGFTKCGPFGSYLGMSAREIETSVFYEKQL